MVPPWKLHRKARASGWFSVVWGAICVAGAIFWAVVGTWWAAVVWLVFAFIMAYNYTHAVQKINRNWHTIDENRKRIEEWEKRFRN